LPKREGEKTRRTLGKEPEILSPFKNQQDANLKEKQRGNKKLN
jgi:hypothetical protein